MKERSVKMINKEHAKLKREREHKKRQKGDKKKIASKENSV
jgi:hypothetical protein